MAEVEKLLNWELDDPVTTQYVSLFDDTVGESIARFDETASSDDILDAATRVAHSAAQMGWRVKAQANQSRLLRVAEGMT